MIRAMFARRLVRSVSSLLAASLATACLGADARGELLTELQRIADSSGGRMGVSALLVKTGERVQLNAAERYPMASTFKVAVALKALDDVDHGRLSLNERIDIPSGELSPGSGEILKDVDPGAPMMGATVGELLEAMMIMSDNTATDHLLERVGGPAAVTRHMRALGIDDIDINRPAANLVADSWGFKLPRAGDRTRQNLRKALGTTPKARREDAARRFLADARDTTTPDAMRAILERLASGAALGKESTALLLDIMSRCKTGPRRLKGELPKGIAVAHKTGTLTRVATNDVGIISLSFGSGPLVVAVYVRGSTLPIQAQERSIAAAALALYRYYK
jgi:beta-lactamase class A